MEWLNIRIALLRRPEYIGSKPIERATWINVLAYSCEQENGGRLIGAAAWKDRQWQQACGVTAREVRAAGKLLRIEGEDVVVFAYSVEKQAEVQARRMQAADAARRRWDSKIGIAPRKEDADASRIPSRDPEREKEREREVVVVKALAHQQGAETSPRPPHDKIVDAADIDRLQTEFPLVEVARERDKALVYVRKERGLSAELELRFFAEVWLPRAPKRSDAKQKQLDVENDEPKDWREWFVRKYPRDEYPESVRYEEKPWSQFPQYLRKMLREECRK